MYGFRTFTLLLVMAFESKHEIEQAKKFAALDKLRDKFAAAAISGLLSNQSDNQMTSDDMVELSFKIANKMLTYKTLNPIKK